MKKGALHHIEIYVSDLKRSSEFWGWLLGKLGYKKYQQWAEGVSWILGDTYIVLVQTQEKFLDIPYHRCKTGLNHLAFHAQSKEQVDEITKELMKRKVNIFISVFIYHFLGLGR